VTEEGVTAITAVPLLGLPPPELALLVVPQQMRDGPDITKMSRHNERRDARVLARADGADTEYLPSDTRLIMDGVSL
jgi:hypothetical protein